MEDRATVEMHLASWPRAALATALRAAANELEPPRDVA